MPDQSPPVAGRICLSARLSPTSVVIREFKGKVQNPMKNFRHFVEKVVSTQGQMHLQHTRFLVSVKNECRIHQSHLVCTVSHSMVPIDPM